MRKGCSFVIIMMIIVLLQSKAINFKDCFSAMSRIAFECEAQNHHPNWRNVYNTLYISLSTHDANGVTEKDFKLADAIEAIVELQE